MNPSTFTTIIKENKTSYCRVIAADPDDFVPIDLSAENKTLTPALFSNTSDFQQYIDEFLVLQKAKFAYGGYMELRNIYARSSVFDATSPQNKPRRLHLGTDIWGAEGTAIMAPFDGKVHSTGFHPQSGNYGATIILEHIIKNFKFYSLFGHCAEMDLISLPPGIPLKKGELLGHFGNPKENGNWPPHLHLQLIIDLEGFTGDYPGVCVEDEKKHYGMNCLDATFLV